MELLVSLGLAVLIVVVGLEFISYSVFGSGLSSGEQKLLDALAQYGNMDESYPNIIFLHSFGKNGWSDYGYLARVPLGLSAEWYWCDEHGVNHQIRRWSRVHKAIKHFKEAGV